MKPKDDDPDFMSLMTDEQRRTYSVLLKMMLSAERRVDYRGLRPDAFQSHIDRLETHYAAAYGVAARILDPRERAEEQVGHA